MRYIAYSIPYSVTRTPTVNMVFAPSSLPKLFSATSSHPIHLSTRVFTMRGVTSESVSSFLHFYRLVCSFHLDPLDQLSAPDYDHFRSSIITLIAWNSPQTLYTVSNPEAVKVLLQSGRKWAKPVESYRILAVYGDNVLTTEGEEWRKHRKVRSFSRLHVHGTIGSSADRTSLTPAARS